MGVRQSLLKYRITLIYIDIKITELAVHSLLLAAQSLTGWAI
jgi:hypothetical protein